MSKFKLKNDISNSWRMRGKKIDQERYIILIIRSWFDPHIFGKKNNLFLWFENDKKEKKMESAQFFKVLDIPSSTRWPYQVWK